ncbi:MAG: hypothetical protein WDO19_10865 [Bacteroidota bacterium]
MIQKNNIDQRVEETLNSLDGIQQASAGPFFYTRLKARLEQTEKSVLDAISSFISRPAMVFATICVVLLLNMIVLFRKQPTEMIPSSADQNEQTLNNAYDVASSTNTTILNIWNQDNEQHIQK